MGYRVKHIATDDGPVKVVQPNMEDERTEMYGQDNDEGFGGRIPLIWHPHSNTVYMGGPDWYHFETREHHGVPYLDNAGDNEYEGYIGGSKNWGQGALSWYSHPGEADHAKVLQALQQQVDPNIEHVDPNWTNDDDMWDDE